MQYLITGASGLIGSTLLQHLQKQDCKLVCQSRNDRASGLNINWIKHDLLNDSWFDFDLPSVDVVFYLAGQTSINRARENPLFDLDSNVLGLVRMLEYFRKTGQKPFIVFASTATLLGLNYINPISEAMKENPSTFYDVSKYAAEIYLRQYIQYGYVNGCILRLANVYGRSSAVQAGDRGVIDKIFSAALAGQNIKVFGTGEYLRDYIHVEDVATAFICAAKASKKTNGNYYYLGTGKSLTLNDAFSRVITLAEKMTKNQVKIEHIDFPADAAPTDLRNVTIDMTNFLLATGWKPQYDFQSGIEYSYLQSNT
jgi:UDP-glucose 4-epimerase